MMEKRKFLEIYFIRIPMDAHYYLMTHKIYLLEGIPIMREG